MRFHFFVASFTCKEKQERTKYKNTSDGFENSDKKIILIIHKYSIFPWEIVCQVIAEKTAPYWNCLRSCYNVYNFAVIENKKHLCYNKATERK